MSSWSEVRASISDYGQIDDDLSCFLDAPLAGDAPVHSGGHECDVASVVGSASGGAFASSVTEGPAAGVACCPDVLCPVGVDVDDDFDVVMFVVMICLGDEVPVSAEFNPDEAVLGSIVSV